MADTDKGRENTLRVKARRQGLILARSKRRDPRARGFGLYALLDYHTGDPMHGDGDSGSIYVLTIDEVERWLS